MKKDKEKLQHFVQVWKWLHLFFITVFGAVLVISLIKRRYILASIIERENPLNISITVFVLIGIIGLILSILIVYGIIKNNKIWFYASIILITKTILWDIVYAFAYEETAKKIINIIGMSIYVGIGYVVYKCKNLKSLVPPKHKEPKLSAEKRLALKKHDIIATAGVFILLLLGFLSLFIEFTEVTGYAYFLLIFGGISAYFLYLAYVTYILNINLFTFHMWKARYFKNKLAPIIIATLLGLLGLMTLALFVLFVYLGIADKFTW